jgi:hypothetical protein
VSIPKEFSGIMAQSGAQGSIENYWTRRFQLIMGLSVAGQILAGLLVYMIFGHSFVLTVSTLVAFLLLVGAGVLRFLQEPAPRRIVLGAGVFILVALLALMASPDFRGGIAGGQPISLLPLLLVYWAGVLALLAFLGKAVSYGVASTQETIGHWIEDIVSSPSTSWFIRLGHLAVAGIAGSELLLQVTFGNRLLLLPLTMRLYDGISLNSVVVGLLAIILLVSLFRFKSPLTLFDGWMILVSGLVCALLQYTLGPGEIAHIDPAMSQSLIVGVNLALSLIPLALAVFALFSEWGRLFTPLWLAVQLLILQQFMGGPVTQTVASGARQSATSGAGQIFLYVLAGTLILLALRLLFYWDRRRLNVVDAITVVLIALGLGLTLWSLGQSDFRQAQLLLSTQQGVNLLSLAYSFIVIVYVIGITAVLFIGLALALGLGGYHNPWSSRIENVAGALLVLGITVGALLLLNAIGNQSSVLAAATLNPQKLGVGLPSLAIRNQYVLDALFVLLLLIYIPALARQHWNRTFAHTERALVLLSGAACWLILANPARRPVLALVATDVQRLSVYGQRVFTIGFIVTTCVLLAALISLLWLRRSGSRVDRIVLLVLFGCAALSAFVYYFFTLSVLLLIPLLLLTPGTLIATRLEPVPAIPEALPREQENGQTVHNPVP